MEKVQSVMQKDYSTDLKKVFTWPMNFVSHEDDFIETENLACGLGSIFTNLVMLMATYSYVET